MTSTTSEQQVQLIVLDWTGSVRLSYTEIPTMRSRLRAIIWAANALHSASKTSIPADAVALSMAMCLSSSVSSSNRVGASVVRHHWSFGSTRAVLELDHTLPTKYYSIGNSREIKLFFYFDKEGIEVDDVDTMAFSFSLTLGPHGLNLRTVTTVPGLLEGTCAQVQYDDFLQRTISVVFAPE